MWARIVSALLIWGLASADAGAADGDPLGGAQVPVNGWTTGTQFLPTVAADGAGGFVVVWEGDGAGDDADYGLHGRRLDATGAPIGDEFQINTYTTGRQREAAVSAVDGGGFVVVWQGFQSGGTDTSGNGIKARRFDAAGLPAGDEFQVNTYTTGHQSAPAVAPTGDGFVVVWASDVTGPGSSQRIRAQRFDAAGARAGEEFQVNSYTTDRQSRPAVAATASGGFVVVWSSYGSAGADDSGSSVQVRTFDAAGVPTAEEQQVNEFAASNQDVPDVSAAGSGFVVVWSSAGSSGTDDSVNSVQARRLDAAGVPAGGEFQVNTYTTLTQSFPSVAADGAGGFVVVWEDESAGLGRVRGQRFGPTGGLLGEEFAVNASAPASLSLSRTIAEALDGVLVVWSGADGDDGGVIARGFAVARITTTTTTPGTPGSTSTSTSSSISVPRPSTSTSTSATAIIPASTTTTLVPGEAVRGRKLQLATKAARPRKSKLRLRVRDERLTLGRGNRSADDPVLHGATVTVSSGSAAGDFSGTHQLAGRWRYVGKVGKDKGYVWKSAAAPIRTVVVRPGKLAIDGAGAGIGFDLDDDPDPVRLEVAIGAHRYCVEFGGAKRFRTNRLYRATQAAAPASCP